MRNSVRLRAAFFWMSLPLLAVSCGGGFGKANQPSSQLAFGVDMARRGLWEEALFRFHQAEQLDPSNPRVQNNLGVAYEAAGDYDKALEHYQKALKLDPGNRELKANYARFVEFYQGYKNADQKDAKAAGTSNPPAQPPDATPPPIPQPGNGTAEAEEPPPANDRPPL